MVTLAHGGTDCTGMQGMGLFLWRVCGQLMALTLRKDSQLGSILPRVAGLVKGLQRMDFVGAMTVVFTCLQGCLVEEGLDLLCLVSLSRPRLTRAFGPRWRGRLSGIEPSLRAAVGLPWGLGIAAP